MRAISAELRAVQQMQSPQARVTVRVEARGQNPETPAVAWQELIGNSGQTIFAPVAAVGLADGRVIKFVGGASSIRQMVIDDPANAASWTGAPATTIRGHGATALAALRFAPASIRLFYIHADNRNVYFIESADNGASWGDPVTVYSAGDAMADLVTAYHSALPNGPWLVGFSAYDSVTGDFTPRFGYHDGAGWVTYAYAPGWRAAGIYPYGAGQTVLVFRQQDRGASRLRALTMNGGVYSAPREIDQTQAGLFGLGLAYFRFYQIPEHGCVMGVAGEYAAGAGVYVGVCGLFSADRVPTALARQQAGTGSGDGGNRVPIAGATCGAERSDDGGNRVPIALAERSGDGGNNDVLADETIILPQIAATNFEATCCLCAAGQDLYCVGDTVVYRGVAQPAPGDLLAPIRYRYDDHSLELEFPAGTPPIQVGQILVIERALRWGDQGGSATLRASVIRVERGSDRVTVLAVDPVGFLGLARCRRPSILNDGSAAGCAEVMRRLCARFGVVARVDDSNLLRAPVLPITLQPAESLLGAAYRICSQTSLYLTPANDGTFAVTMITPPHSNGSGDYADIPHQYGPGAHPVIRAREIADLRRLAFAYILGTYSTDPEDGAALAMAAGPMLPNTRPISYSLTNQRYNSAARVAAAAAAEAARQHQLTVDAVVEAPANLALECYDIVEITEPMLGWSARRFRVRRIVEEWDRGRLVQTLYLGR